MTFNRGPQIAADLIAGIHHPRMKLEFGMQGEAFEVSTGSLLPVEISPANSPGIDAFGRFRVSQVLTLNDFKQVHAAHTSLVWTTGSVGSGSAEHNSDRSSTILTVHTGSGDELICQTKKHFRYTPGVSLVISMTGVFGEAKTNTRKRMGYFSVNDGLYLQLTDSTLAFVLRNSISGSVTEEVIPQNDWNIDKMDGSGSSGINFDPSKTHIFVIDLQWLGVGRVRLGFYDRGQLHIAHEFLHDNVIGSAYMATPTLPIRWEILNTAETTSPTSVEQICFSVAAEGQIGSDGGIVRSANRGTDVQSVSTTKIPLISLRLTAVDVEANVVDITANIVSLTSADYLWEAILNPVISDVASYAAVSNSIVEIDITRSGSVTGGIVLASGYTVSAGTPQVGTQMVEKVLPLQSSIGISEDLAGNRDELVMVVQQISGGPDDFLASLKWRELV